MRREKPDPVSEVHLRQRSTPYDFDVALCSEAGQMTLYRGTSWRFARDAYWQGIKTVRHLSQTATVRIDLIDDGEPYGSFTTQVVNGNVNGKSLHIPFGECLKWAYRSWTLLNKAEKSLATIPGMLRPIRHERRPDDSF